MFTSRFDTFGNVVLEAFANAMPVIAYNCKGPRDIIQHGVNGYLADNLEQLSQQIIDHFSNRSMHGAIRQNALRRSRDYNAESIMNQFLIDLDLKQKPVKLLKQSVA